MLNGSPCIYDIICHVLVLWFEKLVEFIHTFRRGLARIVVSRKKKKKKL